MSTEVMAPPRKREVHSARPGDVFALAGHMIEVVEVSGGRVVLGVVLPGDGSSKMIWQREPRQAAAAYRPQ